jgi:hypothetical protein
MQPASGQAVFKFVLGLGILMIENCHYKKKQLAAGRPFCDTLLSYGLVTSYVIVK